MTRKSLNKKKHFADLAVKSFDGTFRAIFTQANEEVSRLARINSAMRILEDNLLDPDRIQNMDTMQQISLLELLSRNQQVAIRNVMGFSGTLSKVRNLVAIHDGIRAVTALDDEDEDIPSVRGRLLEYDDDAPSYIIDDDDEDE